MLDALVARFILWARRRARYRARVYRVVTFDNVFSFLRFEFLWPDEWPDVWWDRADRAKFPTRPHRPPWWRPFNAFLHCWNPKHDGEEFHDHPRWSITVCLRGTLVEATPWSERTLTPGSIVMRSRKAIHSFRVPKCSRGKTWTLFIVGRRNHRQNRYTITKK